MLPAPEVERAMRPAPQCELHANVPDIRPYFWNASTYIVPMRFGGGVRQKIFEAWAMRVPVVCTTMAAEGTGARSGQECWLEDEPTAFADRVVSLLRAQEPDTITLRAQAHVETRNSIGAAAPQFQHLVERAFHIKRRRPFKLLYDLRWMELGKAGGVEQATYELVSAISRYDHRNQYRIHAPRSACLEWDFPRGFQFAHHFSDPVEKGIEAEQAFLANRLAESLGRPPILTPPMRSLAAYRKLDFDLVHSICSYTHPDLLAFPGILTINDLQHLHHPEFFSPHERQEREKLYREAARRAHHIICISEYTRQDVHRQYGIPLEKMTTVWIIPSRHVWQEIAPGRCDSLLRGMGLEGPFMFYPAQCWPHKNHARLVETFRLIAPHLPSNLKLVFSGRPFPADHPAALLIRDLNLETHVVHLGYRSPLEIRALFQRCLLVVFPSLFEGFGMPVAEAIIAGKPVACSGLTSLPEIAGDAALTFDPTNIHDIGGRILEIVNDPARRADLTAAAIRRRTVFSSRASAVQTLAVYQRVYDELYRT
jgi:glycosyltransferase involved in cell wall biosynthesis